MHEIDVWQVESLRCSFFIDADARKGWSGIWKMIVGSEPESTTEKAGGLHRIEEGIWNGHVLTINTLPDRFDLTWHASPGEFEFGKLGFLSMVLNLFDTSVVENFKKDQLCSVRRFGFAITLLQKVKNRHEGYALLSKYLPAVTIDPNSYDFFYQVNRRIPSSIDKKILLNRLNKWAVVVAQFVSLGSGKPNVASSLYALRLELDVNNAEETLFDSNNLLTIPLIKNIVENAKLITEKGDF